MTNLENNNLKNEIEIVKNNQNNDVGGVQIQAMNIMTMMNQFQLQINQLMNQIYDINQKINLIQMNNLDNFNQMND